MLHDGPGRIYLRHGLLLAVYAEVAYVHYKQCEKLQYSCKNRSSNNYIVYFASKMQHNRQTIHRQQTEKNKANSRQIHKWYGGLCTCLGP